MKKALLFSIMLVGLQHFSAGQWVTIPDPNFVAWLNINGFSSCMNSNQLDTTCNLVTSTNQINCENSNISDLNGIQYFDNLTILRCSYNNLTSLPDLPASLTYLYCYQNQLASLPPLPSNLREIIANNNNLTSLPTLNDSLRKLWVFYNQLFSLPALSDSLLDLRVQYNNLSSLPTLNDALRGLYTGNNNISALPNLNSSLTGLSCGSNPMIFLPALPSGITWLECSNTPLTFLPPLPQSLRFFFCDDNSQLDSLPVLPPDLYHFQCQNSSVDFIYNFPSTLKKIFLTGNDLTVLPSLPDTIQWLDISNNPLLTCLPYTTEIDTLIFDSTSISCLPGNFINSYSEPSVLNFPYCDPYSPVYCDPGYNIIGRAFKDFNSNCQWNAGEAVFQKIKVNLFQGTSLLQQSYTQLSGQYTFKTGVGTFYYYPDTTIMPYFVACPPSHYSIITTSDSTDTDKDFELDCKANNDLGTDAIRASSQLIPWLSPITMHFITGDMAKLYNLNCNAQIPGTVTIYFSGPIQITSIPPTALIPSVGPNSLTYAISSFASVDVYNDFAVNITVDSLAQTGDQVCFTVVVSAMTFDMYLNNNNYTQCFTVATSYDPNQKSVSPYNFITSEDWLTYTIHFQNTGTAPAQHIRITDTLDSDVQEQTFAFLGSSHIPLINVTGNVIKFTFPNINLPDSTSNEPGSHGWVQYKVKSDPGLVLGTTIENTANIYFDFNPPVITNTTVNTVVMPTSITDVNEFTFNMSPNPALNETNIHTIKQGDYQIRVFDITGRIIYQNRFQGNSYPLQVENWPKGLFVVELQDSQGNISRRLLMTGN